MGKIIYPPGGKAGEYAPWAANFYNGCSNGCIYCYNNIGVMAGTLGGLQVRLKKTLIDEQTAFQFFCKDLVKYRDKIIENGPLHFNFVSDPCLPETIELNWKCIEYALSHGVPVQVLTKRADWLNHPAVQKALGYLDLLTVGFSLTGCDDLEPGASPNDQRIWAMQVLHNAGVKTWASIEPIIDPVKSFEMIERTIEFCDHYKIGILSGKKSYTPQDICRLAFKVNALHPKSVYWKESLREFVQKQ